MSQHPRQLVLLALLCGAAILLTGTTRPQALSLPECPTEASERRIYDLVSIEVDGETLEEIDAVGARLPDHWCVTTWDGREVEIEVCLVGHWQRPERVHTMRRADR